jgi:hypothetical protein
MKIERTDSLQHPQQPGGKKKNADPTGERFGSLLEKTISKSMSTAQPGPLQSLPPAGGIAGFILSADKEDLVGRADQLLDLLETYQKKISGPGVPLQDAYISMKAIEDRADELAPFVENLPEGDDFRDFLNRLVITASVEALKFRRGDYL